MSNGNASVKKTHLILCFLLIIVSVVVYFTVGLVPSRDHVEYKRYTAAIPYEFDMDTLPALSDAVNEVAGIPVQVNVQNNVNSGNYTLEILAIPADDIDEKAVVTMLADKYEEMEIESLTSGIYAPPLTARHAGTLLFIYALVLLLIFIVAAFIIDGKNALIVVLNTMLNTLMVLSLYIICRVPATRFLLMALAVVCVMTPYADIVKLRSLRTTWGRLKKPTVAFVLDSEKEKNGVSGIDMLVVAALLSAAFVVYGLVEGSLSLSYFGIMLFAAIGCAIYTSALVVPVIWAGFQKK